MGIRFTRPITGPGFADHDRLGRQIAGRREQGEAFDQLAPGILWRRFVRARAFGCFHVPMNLDHSVRSSLRHTYAFDMTITIIALKDG